MTCLHSHCKLGVEHGLEARDPVWVLCSRPQSDEVCWQKQSLLVVPWSLYSLCQVIETSSFIFRSSRRFCEQGGSSAERRNPPIRWPISTFCTRRGLSGNSGLMILPWLSFENPEEPRKSSLLCWCLHWHGSCVHFKNKLSKHCEP